ncbi:class I SAM-dependent methyltransferase [Winogradskyella eckloniae]|uniref:O-methyltransferase n=1 Tax=Winogradskyella eckloniae TaxID=1089306 RepID=UPI001563141B|nr:class I SAM-dependent methyltransferase [Winogradskyella eckloniae]NRD20572.1 class I SAM-dependent methyltransferase [Winogradskyella eckloniae]
MYQIKSYIKFLTKATNQHGVHSPFIYNFVTKCLYDNTKHPEYNALTTYREALKASKVELEITDLGAGSKVLDSKKRKVSAMVKASSSSKKESQLMFRIAKYFKFKTILELGTSLGMGTYSMSLANKTAQITTIEGCTNTSAFAQSEIKKQNIKNVEFITGSFTDTIPNLTTEKFDCIFFDGHHNKDATIQYFEALLPKIHNDTVFIFDDIYWSKGMTEAWSFIKHHNTVKVTIDCFHIGFVFFRREQVKEHFKIRL